MKQNKFVNALIGEWKNYSRSQILVINALLCAIVMLFALVPIKIGALDLAVIPIIAIIISAEVMGLANGMLTGLFFGLVSFLNHLVKHPSVLSDIFVKNPLVTFLPRILIGVTVFFVIKLFDLLWSKIESNPKYQSKPIKKNAFDTAKYAVGSLLGVITNTAGVLGFIYAFYAGTELSSGTAISGGFITAIIVSNSILEAVVCTILVPPITMAVKKTLQKTTRKNSSPAVTNDNSNDPSESNDSEQ